MKVRVPLSDRLWRQTTKTDSCWLWTGCVDRGGYGRIREQGRLILVHRAVYELVVGPIPDGLELDHLCSVRNCINPAHLEAVTHQENVRRGKSPAAIHAVKTHCPKGHEYATGNIYLYKNRRTCRTCQLAHGQRQYAKKKGQRDAHKV